MGDMVRNFALRLLRRLQKRPIDEAQTDGQANGGGDSDDAMEDGEMPQEEVVQTEFLPEQVELPAQRAQILQHVELIFALCVKHPEFLDEFVAFPTYPLCLLVQTAHYHENKQDFRCV